MQLLVIVDDLDGMGVSTAPHEAQSPSLVDANAVLSLPLAGKGLQPISRRRSQVA